MGYSEVECRLCGTSSNMGRARRSDEPAKSAWSNYGDYYPDGSNASGSPPCTMEGGCRLLKRTLTPRYRTPEDGRILAAEEEDDEDDSDFQFEEPSEDDEEYEYQSDDDAVHLAVDDDGDVEMGDDDTADHDWRGYLQGTSIQEMRERPPGDDQLLPLDTVDKEIAAWRQSIIADNPGDEEEKIYPPVSYIRRSFEHIAGPNCRLLDAYNGHRISAEEMKGCNIMQCLMPNDSGWPHEKYDQEFEKPGSRYALSGITNHMPSRDSSHPTVFPARHGVDTPPAEVVVWDFDPDIKYCMPFHPTCFDLYMRMSRRKLGYIDVYGLGEWYYIEGDYSKVYEFPRHQDVRTSAEQWWYHKEGLEYLAANPLFVPGLYDILRSAIQTDPSFDPMDGAFPEPNKPLERRSARIRGRSPVAAAADDLFHTLPSELKTEIVSYLGSRDIANLRLASRAFRQLPVYIWRRLLQEEMPWLWEIWSDDPPFFWATTSPAHFKDFQTTMKAVQEDLARYRQVLKEDMPEILDDWAEAEKAFLNALPDPALEAYEEAKKKIICGLPAARTNWYQLYAEIKRNWNNMKGLQNRARIWTDLEEILRRIKEYRDEGKIHE